MSKELASITGASIENLFEKAQFLIEKKLVPATFKKAEDLVTVIKIGESIGLDPLASVNSIDLIQGAVAIKAKMIPGILAKAGIAVKVLRDYEQLYDEVPTPIKDKEGKPIVDEDGKMKYFKDPEGNTIYKKKYKDDYITVIRFYRNFPGIGVIENDVEFRWSDAVKAEWHKKSNWKKMPRYMMFARCMSRGARIVGSDVMAGLYDNFETAEFTNADFDINEDGDLVVS